MNILLAVCGSISSYKSLDLARNYIKSGHRVKVILTKGALHFLKPEVYRYLGVEDVYLPTDDFKIGIATSKNPVLHIELARFAERFVVAPMTANTLNSLAKGEAHDLLTNVFLSLKPDVPTLFFPAMNSEMLNHPIVYESLKKLHELNNNRRVLIHPTNHGELACGEIGLGKLADISEIEALTYSFVSNTPQKHILISTGATIAPLDPVRFLTNPSSGLTGILLAREALLRGHKVTLLATTSTLSEADDLKNHPHFKLLRVSTTPEMFEALKNYFETSDAYISAAALCDFSFEFKNEKIKKSKDGVIPFTKAPDLLQWAIEHKKSSQIIVGFAAENPLSSEILLEKFGNKPVDLLIGNLVSENQGFKTPNGCYRFLKDNMVEPEIHLKKNELACKIMDFLDEDSKGHAK